MAKTLIVFYSRADENYVNGVLQTLRVGNTEVAAGMIRELTGADMFKIEQTKPYAKGYNDCIEEARMDQRRNARPELKTYPDNLDAYDVIYLGFPNYWSTMPMAVFTFLEHYDFSGKTIRPFCTHEGSGMGSSIKDIKKICKAANVEEGLAIRGGSVERSRKEIETWIKEA
ncbi:MAG: flavodoxin [Wujia sp.]